MVEDGISSLADLVRRHAAERPDAVALIFDGRETSFGLFDLHTNRIANGLIAAGCEAGDHVAYIGKNRDEYFECWLGAVKAGLVMTPINWRLAQPEIAYILHDCRPRLIVCEPEFLPRIADIDAQRIVTDADDLHPLFSSWRDSQSDADPHREAGYDDAVLQLYTSGTTGNPKGALLSNRSLLALRASTPVDQLPEWYRWTEDDVALIAMPVFHISGSGWGLWSLQHGAKGIVVREFDPAHLLDLLVTFRITKIIMVPTALKILCDHPAAASVDTSFLKYVCYGGSAIPLDLLRRAMAIFGCGFAQMYGMTETAGTVISLPPEDHDPDGNQRMRGIGRALPGVRVRIADDAGDTLPPGAIGEIMVASDANMIGYFQRPEATAETIDSNGWLHTGDAGWMDEDGYLYLADRIKDMIITGGENVYPAEVEQALHAHPQVSDVAVIGIPDAKWGEAVKAIVIPAGAEPPDPAELIAWARERIAAYKVPKSIDFRQDLPRNSTGKILRRVLRDEYR